MSCSCGRRTGIARLSFLGFERGFRNWRIDTVPRFDLPVLDVLVTRRVREALITVQRQAYLVRASGNGAIGPVVHPIALPKSC